jgi:cytochrome c-type biogenesis protein CcmH
VDRPVFTARNRRSGIGIVTQEAKPAIERLAGRGERSMTTFWIIAGVMALLAMALLLAPMLKSKGPAVTLPKPWLIGLLVVALPALAFLTYNILGNPQAIEHPSSPPSMQMPAGHPSAEVMNMDLSQLADKLAMKLKNQPDNAEGWALLARTYVQLKRHNDAVAAFEKSASLLPKDPHLMADYADALAMSQGGKFDGKAESLVDKALVLDPMHVKALMLKATIEFNRKNYTAAIKNWEKLLTVPGLDAETTKEARGSIEESQRLMSAGK